MKSCGTLNFVDSNEMAKIDRRCGIIDDITYEKGDGISMPNYLM